jgi:hypothetical protein
MMAKRNKSGPAGFVKHAMARKDSFILIREMEGRKPA